MKAAILRHLFVFPLLLSFFSLGHAQQSPQGLRNHVRPAVSSGQAALVGSLPPEQQLNFSIVLPLRNQAELISLLKRLYDPSSSDYRHFLSVAQFTEQFAPTEEDYQAVVSFARSNGFNITGKPANRLLVPLSGTVAQINNAFNLSMNFYQHPTEDRTFFSPDREPSLNLSVPVAHISGLNNYSIPRSMLTRPQYEQQIPNVTGSGPGGSYLGSDMRAAYYGGTTLDGNGQTVGLLEFGGYNLSDVNASFSNAGQSYGVAINNVLLDGATAEPIGNTDDAEQVLDIVQAIGMAPGLSQVRVYIGNGSELDDANILNTMASENIAKQLSCSWSWKPDDPSVADVFFQEFAAQGQSFFAASGDDGAFDLAISPYFYPQEDPYVTAVGGTHLTTDGVGGQWLSETAWNSRNAGSGGGISPDGISIPSWQTGLASSSNSGSSTLRNVPDVAMEGDFDNYYCGTGSCAGDGAGTSFAAPRWAGFMALINQQAIEAGTAPQGGVGFINPAIYSIGEGSSYSRDIHDITVGNNKTYGQPTWFSAVTGYDLVTGWGSANGQYLIDDLAGPQVPGFWILASSSTVSIKQGTSSSTTFTVTDAGGFTGNVTLAITSALPSGVTASWGTNPTSGTSVLTLTASSSAPSGTTALTITGTSGSVTATTNITVAVHAPSFSLSGSPSSLGVDQGSSGTTTINVTPQYGFTGSVNLDVSGLPSGVTASWGTNPTSGSSVLTLAVSSSATPGTTTLTVTGTSGSLTATTTVALSIYGPSFTLSGGGVLNIGQGTSSTTYIYVNPQYGFTGSVSLSVSGLPTGVTASFSPNPATGMSTLTVTASSSASLGTTTVTITGTSGSLTATTTLSLGVYAPTFTLSGGGSLDIGQGAFGTTYIYVNPQYGFTGGVSLSVSGLPAGVTASFSPNPATGNSTSTLTVTASSSAAIGQYTLTVTGTSGSLTATTTLSLGVYAPTFTISANSLNLGQGSSGTSYVWVNSQYGFAGSVSFSVSGLPTGVTGLWNPNPTTGNSMLTLTASSSAAIGQYPLTVTGTSGSLTKTTTLSLGVYAPTFTIYANSLNIGQGTSGATYAYVNPQYGFTGSVNFSVSGLPSGVTASFSPNPATGSSTLTLTASSSTAIGQYPLTVTGTSGSLIATTSISLGVYAPTFTIYANGLNIGQGTSGTTYADVNPQYGFTGSVTFSVSGLPSGVTASFSPNPTTGSSTLTLASSSSVAIGQYPLTVTGKSGTLTATTTISLGIYQPSFTLSASNLNIGQGSSSTSYIWTYPQYGFTGNINLAVSGLPSGVTASFSPNPTTGSSTLTLTASSSTAIGQYPLTLTGTSGNLTATTTLYLGVYAPTFTLSGGNVNIGQGSTGTSNIWTYANYGFTGSVNLAVSGLPSGVTASFSPNPTTGNSTLTLTASSSTAIGQYPLTVTGTSGSLTATANISLGVYAPTFSFYASPSGLNLNEGSSGTSTIYINTQYGFTGSVSLAASNLPSGVIASFAPNPTSTGSSLLTLTASNSVVPGSATVTITGTSGSVTETNNLSLTINAPGFTLVNAPGDVNVIPGGSDKSTISVVPQNGFSGNVNLAVTGLPSGVTASWSPNPTTGSSVLTLTATNSATPGTTTATITGTSGALIATTSLAVTVRANPAITTTTLAVTSAGTPVTSVASGTAVTLTATVSAGSTALTNGQVKFCDASAAYCADIHLLGTAQLTSAKTAALKFIPGPGSHSYKAVFVGTYSDGTSSSNASALAVTASNASTTTITQSGNPGNYTLTATVAGQGSRPPAGAVSFLDTSNGNSVLDTAALGQGVTSLSWHNSQSIATGSYPSSIASGDFNGDGIPDMAVVNPNSNTLTILLGNGDGTFKATATSPQTGSNPVFVAVGDFNNDGKADLAVANFNSNTLTILLGNGEGTFTATAVNPTTGSDPQSIAVGDFNGDGILDLAVANYSSNTVTVLLGNGDGTFTASPMSAQTGGEPISIVAGDFNGDGILDLAVTNSYGNPVTILLGSGDGSFTAGVSPQTGNGSKSIVTGDFNGDGIPDLAFANSSGNGVSILLGNGDGTFTATSVSPPTLTVPGSVAIGDFNGDGEADLAVTNPYSNIVTVLLGNGDGTFTAGGSPQMGSYPASIVTGDFNRDGIPDLAVANYYGSTLTVMTAQLAQTATATASGIAIAGTGTHLIDASYPGDGSYGSSISATTGLTAQIVTPTVTVTPGSLTITKTQPLTVTGAVSGGSGNPSPTGLITLTGGGYSSTQALSSGSAQFTITAGFLSTGSDTFTASYTPDSQSSTTYNSATGTSQQVTVTLATPTVTVTPSSFSITPAQPLTVTVAVSGAPTPTGSISLTGGGYSSTQALSSGSTQFSITAGSLSIGSDTFTANYTPDSSSSVTYNNATGASTAVTVMQANPVPVISGISPLFTNAGGSAFTLTVNGSGFISGSTAYWGTSALTTTYGSANQLTAQVPAADIATGGTTTAITVQTPSPGGGTSNSFMFEVNSASGSATGPTFTSTTATVTAGSSASYPVTLPSSVESAYVTCLNLPTGAACSYSATANTLSITTSSTTPKGTYQITVVFTETVAGAATSWILLPILLLPLVFLRRKLAARGAWVTACLGLVLLTVAAYTAGCGGGGSTTTTPPPQTHQVVSSGSIGITIQ